MAVVGSRHVDDELITYTEKVGQSAANSQFSIVSGGARGIDQAAMRGALEAGGKVIGMLADSLERAAINREHREFLINGQLLLISPFDPAAGFNVGNAMQRNKLIYAMADSALVVCSDHEKGGTWAGAVEQLDKLRFVPVYVRLNGKPDKALDALRQKGALLWPDPESVDDFAKLSIVESVVAESLIVDSNKQERTSVGGLSPSQELFDKARELVLKIESPKTISELADYLQISKPQAKDWLERMVEEGSVIRTSKPVKYSPNVQQSLL